MANYAAIFRKANGATSRTYDIIADSSSNAIWRACLDRILYLQAEGSKPSPFDSLESLKVEVPNTGSTWVEINLTR